MDIIKYLLDNYEVQQVVNLLTVAIPEDRFNKLLFSSEILQEVLSFKKYPIEYYELSNKARIVLRNLSKLDLYSLLDFKHMYNSINPQLVLKKTSKSELLEIMSKIDVNTLVYTIFNDDNLYKNLNMYLDKYKLLCSTSRFFHTSEIADTPINTDVVASFITNFKIINRELMKEKDRVSITKILDIANAFDSMNDIYSYLFGKEDFLFIKRNPEPYSGILLKKDRLERGKNLLLEMNKRKYITVPPINEDLNLSSGRKINVLVGNTNEPINLTYGERTSSCMRMGGVGDSLFEFCLLNENGFHISFNEPTTGELISRVSGFRNGNTVFLNQLRYSLSKKITSEDLIEACNYVANKIIINTKNSEYPINNVLISPSYAYGESHIPPIDLNVKNIKKTLPKFYSDVKEFATIVATSNQDNTLVPIELNSNKVVRYNVLRNRIKKYVGNDCMTAIGHIIVLDEFYGGNDIYDTKISYDNIELVYQGEDWFIALDNKKNIFTYIMKNTKDYFKAQQEVNEYLNMINQEKIDNKNKIKKLM